MLDSDDGIPPVSLFWSNHKPVNFVNIEMEDGIVPLSSFSVNDNMTRSVKGIFQRDTSRQLIAVNKQCGQLRQSPISLGIEDPVTISPSLKLSNLSIERHSVKDGWPINSHATSSGVDNEVEMAVGIRVAGEEGTAGVEGGSVAGDVPPAG
ncbi:hypothetical protein MHU86_15874 [Fragilaria crotonensis]|nr:hypothetical protein MHU86_15874 [Fragilaria crotonensis]